MNILSDQVWLVFILDVTLILNVNPQNIYSYNFDQQSDQVNSTPVSSGAKSCDLLSAVHRDQNGPYGSITISNPDYRNIVIKVVYSVAARLPSVRPQVIVRVVMNLF